MSHFKKWNLLLASCFQIGIASAKCLAATEAIDSRAMGTTSVELGLTVAMSVSANGTRFHDSGTLQCNPFGKNGDRETFSAGPVTPMSQAGNGIFAQQSIGTDYVLNTNYADAHWMSPRALHVVVTNGVSSDGLVASVAFQDRQTLSATDRNEGDCSHTIWTARATKDSLNGRIAIRYRMPENAWAVRVSRTESTGIFSTMSGEAGLGFSPLKGMLNASKDPQVKKTVFTAWARPGTDISQEIQFKDLNLGGLANGSVKLEFAPAVSRRSILQPAERLNELSKAIEASRAKSDSRDERQTYDDFTSQALDLLSRPDVMDDFLARNRTSDIFALTKSLSRLAGLASSASGLWDARTAASLLGYEIATRLLDEISPYCEKQKIHLDYQNRDVEISGLRFAHFYLARAQSRIDNYKMVQFDAFLDQLQAYQDAGKTYREVYKNATEMKKLRQAYEALQLSLHGVSPFHDAMLDIQKVWKRFGSIGAGHSTTIDLFSLLQALAADEDKFSADFSARLRKFGSGDPSVVQSADLQTRVADLAWRQTKLLTLLRDQVRFLSLGPSGAQDQSADFGSEAQSLISDNIAVLEKPLLNSDFENVRAAYVSDARAVAATAQADKCQLGILIMRNKIHSAIGVVALGALIFSQASQAGEATDSARRALTDQQALADSVAEALTLHDFQRAFASIAGRLQSVAAARAKYDGLEKNKQDLFARFEAFASLDAKTIAQSPKQIRKLRDDYDAMARERFDLSWAPTDMGDRYRTMGPMLRDVAERFRATCGAGRSTIRYQASIDAQPAPPRYEFEIMSSLGDSSSADYQGLNYVDRQDTRQEIIQGSGYAAAVSGSVLLDAALGFGASSGAVAAASAVCPVAAAVFVAAVAVQYSSDLAKANGIAAEIADAEGLKFASLKRDDYIAAKYRELCKNHVAQLDEISSTISTLESGGAYAQRMIAAETAKSEKLRPASEKLWNQWLARCDLKEDSEISDRRCAQPVSSDGIHELVMHRLITTIGSDQKSFVDSINKNGWAEIDDAQERSFTRLMKFVALANAMRDGGLLNAQIAAEERDSREFEVFRGRFVDLVAQAVKASFGKIPLKEFRAASRAFEKDFYAFRNTHLFLEPAQEIEARENQLKEIMNEAA